MIPKRQIAQLVQQEHDTTRHDTTRRTVIRAQPPHGAAPQVGSQGKDVLVVEAGDGGANKAVKLGILIRMGVLEARDARKGLEQAW